MRKTSTNQLTIESTCKCQQANSSESKRVDLLPKLICHSHGPLHFPSLRNCYHTILAISRKNHSITRLLTISHRLPWQPELMLSNFPCYTHYTLQCFVVLDCALSTASCSQLQLYPVGFRHYTSTKQDKPSLEHTTDQLFREQSTTFQSFPHVTANTKSSDLQPGRTEVKFPLH